MKKYIVTTTINSPTEATLKFCEIADKKDFIFVIDPEKYSEAEVERGKMLLEAKADRYRDEFKANQDKYLLPKEIFKILLN